MNASTHIESLMTGGSAAAQAIAVAAKGGGSTPADTQGQETADYQAKLESMFAAILNAQNNAGASQAAAIGTPNGNAAEGTGKAAETGGNTAGPQSLIIQMLARLIAGGSETNLSTLTSAAASGEAEGADQADGVISLKEMVGALEDLLSGVSEGALDPAVAANLQQLLAVLKQMDAGGLSGGNTGKTASGNTGGAISLTALFGQSAGQPMNTGAGGETANHAASQQTAGNANRASLVEASTPLKDFLETLSPSERARLAAAIRNLAAGHSGTQSGKSGGTHASGALHAADKGHQAGLQSLPRPAGPGDPAPSPQKTAGDGAVQQKAAQAAGNLENLAKDMRLRVHRSTGQPASGQLLNAETAASAFAARLAANGHSGGKTANAEGATSTALNQITTPQAGQTQAAQAQTGQGIPQTTQLLTQAGLPQLQPALGTAMPAGTGLTGPQNDGISTANEGAVSGASGAPPQPGGVQMLDSSLARIARTPMTPQAPPVQVAAHMTKAAEQGLSRFMIQLHPADLGKVEVDMNMNDDGKLHAVIRADRPETLHLLERDARVLQQALETAGLKADSGSLSFSLNQGGKDGGNQTASQGGPKGNGTASPEDNADPAIHSRHDGQLDVWT